MTTTTVTVTAKVCDLDHGGPGNSAEVYGHHGSNRVCLRLVDTDIWIYEPEATS